MRVALVGTELEENLGLRYLAAVVARCGHDPFVIAYDGPAEAEAVAGRLAAERYDVVGLSLMFQLRAREMVGLAERARALGFGGLLVAGGQHATFMAREILEDNPSFDAIVLGDGEAAMAEICARWPAARTPREALSEIAGLVVRADDGAVFATPPRTERTDLATLAPPLREVTRQRHLGIGTASIIGGRGCYANCSFCSIVAWEKLSGGPKFRQRPVDHVADEMAALYDDFGVRVFNFQDDNFWLPTPQANHERLAMLQRALTQRGVGDVALCLKCRPNDVDEGLFARARDMGLVRVYVGIETDAPAGLITLRRGVTQPQNQQALDVLGRLDLHACSNLLLFDPDTALDDVTRNLDFLSRNAQHTLNFCRVEAYGGTPLTARLADEGRLYGDYLGFDYTLAEPRVELLWRITHLAFHDRNFPLDGPANAMIGLAYRFHLAKRFWPSARLERLRAPVFDLVERFNGSQVTQLGRALEFARAVDVEDRDAIAAFAVELAGDVRAEDVRFGAECEALVEALEHYAVAQGAGRSDGRLGEGASGSGFWHHLPEALALSVALAGASAPPAEAQDGASQSVAGAHTSSLLLSGDDAARLVEAAVQETPAASGRTWRVQAGGVSASLLLAPPPRPPFVSNGCNRPPPVPVHHPSLLSQVVVDPASGFEIVAIATEPDSGVHVRDLWLGPGGHQARFLVARGAPPEHRRLLHVAVELRNARGQRLRVAAPFNSYPAAELAGLTPGTTPVPLPPPEEDRFQRRFMGCDPVAPLPMAREAAPPVMRAVHIAVVEPRAARTTPWGPVVLETWVEPTVRGDVTEVTASVRRGSVSVTHPFRDGRRAQLRFDPRDEDGRVIAGRHRVRVRFVVGRRLYTARIDIRVDEQGARVARRSLHVSTRRAPRPRGSRPDEGALGTRTQATIDAHAEGGGFLLSVRRPPGFEDARVAWRASAGRVTPRSDGDIHYRPPVQGRAVVTCTLTTRDASVAIGTFRPPTD